MPSCKCLWCDSFIDQNVKVCPECSCLNAEPKVRTRHGTRTGVVLGLLALPLMVSLAFASRLEHSVMDGPSSSTVAAVVAQPVAPQRVVTFANPVEQATWVNGQRSLGLLLGKSSYTAFMSTGAGNVVSLCGTVQGTIGYQTKSGRQRYISVFGRPDGTVLETQDPSFQVLWTRVCKGSGTVA
jgi:hypothetical protein